MLEIDEPNLVSQAIAYHPAPSPSSHNHGSIAVDTPWANTPQKEYTQLHRFREFFPPIQAIAQLRNQYLDEMLRQQIASGCRQVVILGTGFDACADRFAALNVRCFEMGAATIMQHKLAQLPEHHSPKNTTYIAEDYLQSSLIERLQQHQFNVHLPTYFIWADSVSSLKRGDIIALIDTLRNQVHQFHLSFDYLSHQVLDRSSNNSELNQTLDHLTHLGISWRTVFKDIATFTRGLGLKPLEIYSIAQLHDRYCPQSSLPSTLLHIYYICTITKQIMRW